MNSPKTYRLEVAKVREAGQALRITWTLSVDGAEPQEVVPDYALSRVLTDTCLEDGKGIFSYGPVEFTREGDLDVLVTFPREELTPSVILRRALEVHEAFARDYPPVDERESATVDLPG